MLPIPVPRRMMRNEPFNWMQQEMDRFLNDLWGPEAEEGKVTGAYPVDIQENENAISVDAELPGFKSDDVDVDINDGRLTITAERAEKEEEDEKEKTRKHLTERRYRRVQRSFNLPSSIDENNVDASLRDGVLHLELPKAEKEKPKKINIKTE